MIDGNEWKNGSVIHKWNYSYAYVIHKIFHYYLDNMKWKVSNVWVFIINLNEIELEDGMKWCYIFIIDIINDDW